MGLQAHLLPPFDEDIDDLWGNTTGIPTQLRDGSRIREVEKHGAGDF